MSAAVRRGKARTWLRAAALVWDAAPVHATLFAVVAMIGSLIPVVVAWLTKNTLDRLVTGGSAGVLVGLGAGLAGCGLIAAAGPQFSQYLRSELDRRAGLLAKDRLFAALERFSGLARFEDPTMLDRLRLAQQSTAGPSLIVDSGLAAGRAAVTLVGFVASLALLNPWFTAVVIAAAVPVFAVELRLSKYRAATLWQIGPGQRREFFYTALLASTKAAKEIRLLRLGDFLRRRMKHEMRAVNVTKRKMDRRELRMQGSLVVLAALISGSGLVWVLLAAGRGEVSVGDVTMFVTAVAAVQVAIDGLVGGYARLHQYMLVFDHYVAVLDEEPDLPTPSQPAEFPTLRQGIELRDVWFRYSEDHPWVLRGVNLSIPHGTAVALVGKNGSGKSTLVKLLCRFYDPDRGTIHWDGVDIRDISIDELRDRIGAVFQDFMCYEFTAADNIAVGDLGVADEISRIEGAAKQAGVHDTIAKLPMKYRTLLSRAFRTAGDGDDEQTGVVLSGGQWQRLALARAFLRENRDLMILDEPSSGLDAEAEHDIHHRLREIRVGRTSLLISHRLGAIRDAERIVVLSEGVVTEQGGHAELMAVDGVYARLFTLQASGYAEDRPPRPAGRALTGVVVSGTGQ